MATQIQSKITNELSTDKSYIQQLMYPVSSIGMPVIPWKFSAILVFFGFVFFGTYRVYLETHSFSVGLDYFEPEFKTYWMNLLYAQGIIITLILVICAPALWLTRPDDVTQMTPIRELSIYNLIFGVLAAGSIFIVIVLGVYVEADAAWHQVTIRDTDFTPTHIGLFYMAIPLALVAIVLGFIWMHTRMPDYRNRVSLPLALVATAPILIMPNLGLNEWGHTFFYAEELFAAPIHWGFVTLGWGLFGMAGFILQCLTRVRTLTKIVPATF